MNTNTPAKTPQEILTSIINSMNIRISTFAKGLDQPYTRIFDIYRGKTRVFSDAVIKALVEKYNVNESYILTGEGEMFKTDPYTINGTTDELTNSFLRVTSLLTEKNNKLKEEIERLKALLDEHGIQY